MTLRFRGHEWDPEIAIVSMGLNLGLMGDLMDSIYCVFLPVENCLLVGIHQ